MNRLRLFIVSVLLLAVFNAGITSFAIARPPCRSSTKVQVSATSVATVSAGVVAVPFAVPVAMPSYVQYSAYTPNAGIQYSTEVHATEAAVVCGTVQTTGNALAQMSNGAVPATSLVTARCTRCHGATQPKAGLDLTRALDDATRLKAIARVLADDPQVRMPKGTELSPSELGQLIQELAARPAPTDGTSAPPAPAANAID
ncbi:MAG TPA: hypothetical protein VGN12_10475 [Pirellulales bacterium]|jgi:hypothetical protein